MTMNNVKRVDLEKILSFLYWEETVDKGFLPIERIQDETGLTNTRVQEGLNTLGFSGLVNYTDHQKDIGIEKARITIKGKKRAEQLNNIFTRVQIWSFPPILGFWCLAFCTM